LYQQAHLVVTFHSEPDLSHGIQVGHVCSCSMTPFVVHVKLPQHLHHQQQLDLGLLHTAGKFYSYMPSGGHVFGHVGVAILASFDISKWAHNAAASM